MFLISCVPALCVASAHPVCARKAVLIDRCTCVICTRRSYLHMDQTYMQRCKTCLLRPASVGRG